LQKYCADLAAAAPKLVSQNDTPPLRGTPLARGEPALDVGGGQTSNLKPQTSNLKIMGPIPAQIYQIRNWYRMRFLVSGDERANLQPAVKRWLSKVKQPANVRIKIDVNPQSFS